MIYQTNHEKNHLPIICVINRESKLVKWVFKNTSVNYQLQSNKLHLQIAHGDNSRLAKVRYFIVKKVMLAFFFISLSARSQAQNLNFTGHCKALEISRSNYTWTPNDGFLPNALKTLLRIFRVLLDLQKCILTGAIKFVSVRSYQSNLSLF